MVRSKLKNDAGTNILIEYIISFCILAVLFTILMIMLNDTIKNANNITLDEQLGIIANDIANRVSRFSSEVSGSQSISPYQKMAIMGYQETIELPALAQSDQYQVEIIYDPAKHIYTVRLTSFGTQATIVKEATFKSAIQVESRDSKPFLNTNGVGTMYYDGTKIIIAGY